MASDMYFDQLGFFALGIFVGSIATQPMRFSNDADASVKAIVSVLPAALAGTAVTFLQVMDKAEHGMSAYAIGLLVALLWVHGYIASKNIDQNNGIRFILGILHFLAISVISAYATLIFIPDPLGISL